MSQEEKLEQIICMQCPALPTRLKSAADFTPLTGEGIRLRTVNKGEILIYTGETLSKMFLLVQGDCRIVNYSLEGKQIFSGTVSPPQMFGLYELIQQISAYTATVECLSDCYFFETDQSLTLSCLQNRPAAAFGALRLLALFADDLLKRSNRITLHNNWESLLLYIYSACHAKRFPTILTIKREDLAGLLHLNLRTLYRRLDQMEEKELLCREHGKIKITERGFQKLEKEVKKIL